MLDHSLVSFRILSFDLFVTRGVVHLFNINALIAVNMVLAADKERVKTLLKDTITLLCRNGLTFKSKFSIEALIGVTLDDEDIFLVSINELIKNELCKSTEKSSSTEESAEESVSGEELQSKQHRSRKRKRAKHVKVKREPGASDMSDGGGFSEDGRGDDDQNGGPVIKKQPLDDNGVDEESGSITGHRLQVEQSFDETAENSNDEDSGDIVFIKQEMDTWSENAANASQANFNFSQGANRSQGDMNFSSLSDMNLVPVTSQEEGSMVWPSGGMQQRMPFPGRSATVTAGGSTQQSGDGQMAQQPHQVCSNYHLIY
jgi:hypothetical protein